MLLDGFVVMLIGIGAVFFFLVFLVLILKVLPLVLSNFKDNVNFSETSEDLSKIALAILVAKKYRELG